MDHSYEVKSGVYRSDFEIKIQDPVLFQKISNDNLLFVFAEASFNTQNEENGVWIIPRSNREELRKVN
jgi:hypothetical protein